MLRDYLHYGTCKLAARVYNDTKGHVILHDRLVTHAHDRLVRAAPDPRDQNVRLFLEIARVCQKALIRLSACPIISGIFQTPQPRR